MADPQPQSSDILTSGDTSGASSTRLTIPEFAQKIKERSPDLADIPDAELARKVFESRPDLMQYVQTMEPRKHSETPGMLKRFGQALGVPTSAAELESLDAARESHPVMSFIKETDPGVQTGEMVYNYAKGVWEQGKARDLERSDALRNIYEGGPVLANLGKIAAADTDFLLKGALGPVGGTATETASEDFRRKNYWGMFGDVAGATILSILALSGTKADDSAAATGAKAVKENERLASLVSNQSTPTLDSAAIADATKPLLKQVLKEEGITDADLKTPLTNRGKGVFPPRRGIPSVNVEETNPVTNRPMTTSNLRAGARKVLDVVSKAVDVANRPFEKVVQEYGNEPLGDVKAQVVGKMRERAQDYALSGDKELAAAINSQADIVEKAQDVRGLNDIKVHANKEIGNTFAGKTPGQLSTASVNTANAWGVTADTIREFLYPELQRLSGVDLTKFGARESAAIKFRDGVYRTYYTSVDPNQAEAAARGYIGNLEEGSWYTRHLWKRLLGIIPEPAGLFNTNFRKGLGKLGEGGELEKVSTTPTNQKLLTGDTRAPRFQVPSGIPREVIEGQGTVPAARTYVGQETVPNPDYTPMTGVSPKGEAESATEKEIRGGGKESSAADRVRTLQSVVDNLQAQVDNGQGNRFNLIRQLRDAQDQLAQAEKEAFHFDWGKTQSVGQGESDAFSKAREELFPGKRELTTEEIGKVSARAKELGRLDLKGLAERSSQRAADLGSQRSSTPTRSVTGSMSSPEERAAQLGPQGAAVPERSLTGSPTKQQSRWQYLTGAREPGATESARIEGPGVFETSDPKAAAGALRGMTDFIHTEEFRKLPFATRERIRGAIIDLDQQLREYAAYRMRRAPRRVTVTPMREGTVPRTKSRALGAGLAGSSEQSQSQAQAQEGTQ